MNILKVNLFAVCHTIATTKLAWCEKKAEDVTGDGDLDKQALTIVRELQTVEDKKEDNVRVSSLLRFKPHEEMS
jgi:hypothetical protein